MAIVGFLQNFVGKADLGGPMDSVCLRTASVEWNVPGKYGPHGELFFLPDSEGAGVGAGR